MSSKLIRVVKIYKNIKLGVWIVSQKNPEDTKQPMV